MRPIRIAVVLLLFFIALAAPSRSDAQDAAPRLVLQTGHLLPVTQVVFAPDGTWLATGGKDGAVKVWDTASGRLKMTLPIYRGPVQAIDYVATAKTMSVASADGAVTTWDPATGTLIAIAHGPVAAPTASALVLRSGSLIAACAGPDHAVETWTVPAGDAASVAASAKLTGHAARVTCMRFSADGAYLGSGASDGEVRVWDVDDQSLFQTLKGHAMPIRDLAFTANGKKLLDASDDGIAILYDVTAGKDVGEFQLNAPGDGIGAVALSPSGSELITAGAKASDVDQNLQVWDVATQKVLRGVKAHGQFVDAVAFSPDGKSIATGSLDDTARLWDATLGAPVHTFGGTDAMASVAWARNGTMLVGAGGDGSVRVWDATTGELLHAFGMHTGAALSVAVTADGKTVASGGADSKVVVADLDTGAVARTLTAPGPVHALAISPDGTLIAAGCGTDAYDGALRFWNASTGAVIPGIDGQGLSEVRSLVFSADGTVFATVSGGGEGPTKVDVWDTHTGKQLFDDFGRRFRSVAVTPDGRRLIAFGGTEDDDDTATGSQVVVYNLRTYALQKTVANPEPDDFASAGAVSPDSHTAAAGEQTGAVRLFDAKTGEPLRVLTGHQGPVLCAAFSPDGTALATSGADSTIRVWDVATGRLRASLVPFATTDDWLAATPEGYYDGSPGAARYIRWQCGNASFPVEAFDQTLRRPAEVAKSITGGAVDPPPGGAVGASGTPPTVAFVAPLDGDTVSDPSVDVVVRVSSSDPVQKVLLFANGRPVMDGGKPLDLGAKPLDLGAKPLDLGAKPLDLGAKALTPGSGTGAQYTGTVAFPPGDSSLVISAVATDSASLQSREDVRVERPASAATNAKLYVLSVGVTHYSNPHFDLKYAAADAQAFSDLWNARAGSLYSAVVAAQLTDDKATVANVQSALFKLLGEATDQDTVVIYLSGHGLALPDDSYYFATYEVDPSTEQTVDATALPWTALETALSQIKARHVLLFLDACHSGAALGDKQARAERMAELLARNAGVIVFSSSRGGEYSYELDQYGHGAFTQALLEGVGEGKANFVVGGQQSKQVTAEELLAYLRLRVPQLTDNRQTPSCPLLQDFGDPFPLAE